MKALDRRTMTALFLLAIHAKNLLEGLTTPQRRALEALAAAPQKGGGWVPGWKLAEAASGKHRRMDLLEARGLVMITGATNGGHLYKITPKGISLLARIEWREENDPLLQLYRQSRPLSQSKGARTA